MVRVVKLALQLYARGYELFLFLPTGDSLGKTGSAGIVNPIGVEVKNNRMGLGREAVLREIREQKERIRCRKWERRKKRENEMTPEEFRWNDLSH